jgi:hypothetical protein
MAASVHSNALSQPGCRFEQGAVVGAREMSTASNLLAYFSRPVGGLPGSGRTATPIDIRDRSCDEITGSSAFGHETPPSSALLTLASRHVGCQLLR